MAMSAKWVVTKDSPDTADQQITKAKGYIEKVQTTLPNDQAVGIQYDDKTGRLLMVFSDKATSDYSLKNGTIVLADYNGLKSLIDTLQLGLDNAKLAISNNGASISDLQKSINDINSTIKQINTAANNINSTIDDKISAALSNLPKGSATIVSDAFNIQLPYLF